MEQDDGNSQRWKRCKLESVTQNGGDQLHLMASTDTHTQNRTHLHPMLPMTSNDATTQNEALLHPIASHDTINSKRRCMHCQTDYTPQWRQGPMGPKTLCNACGLQYNNFGWLLPEYRPAASPTYSASKHSTSNSQKKTVTGMRRSREPVIRAQGVVFELLPQPQDTFPTDTYPQGVACTSNPLSIFASNIDVSKFLKPNATINPPMLLRMLTDGLHADITLKAQGGSVKAHRCILATVSPFFGDAFKHPKTKDLEMKDISYNCLELFLVLLYIANDDVVTVSGFEGAVDKHLVELFQACKKYDVDYRLSSILINALSRCLGPENCWQFCNSNSSSDLAPSDFPPAYVCHKYIVENFDKVLESKNVVLEMKRNPELVLSFMRAYASRINGRNR